MVLPGGTVATTSSTICIGDIPSAITISSASATGTISYRWQESTDNITFIDISGAIGTSATYTPTSSVATTTYYRRVTISTLNGVACEEASTSAIVNVTPAPLGNLQASAIGGNVTAPGVLTICPGEEVTFSASGGASYAFRVNNIILQARGTSNTYTSTSLLNNEFVTVDVFNQVAGGCSAISDSVTITYATPPTISLSSDAIAETICTGDSVTFSATSNVASSTFEFFINGSSQGAASTVASFTSAANALVEGSEVSVVVITPSGCSETTTLTMVENGVTWGNSSYHE
jgi:hypothetical protein